jgi:hypothetical protein
VEVAMSDFEGAARAAQGLAGNAEAIHDLAHLVVTDQDLQWLKAFQHPAHELEEHAGKLEAAARARNVQELRTQVGEVLEYCVACHQSVGCRFGHPPMHRVMQEWDGLNDGIM